MDMNTIKQCVLHDGKICDGCGECNKCELDPEKICDNCMACLETDVDYAVIRIYDIIKEEDYKD